MKQLPQRQVAGMAQAYQLGQVLAEEHPELANHYRDGSTTLQLARNYLPEHVETSQSVAMNAIRYALQQLVPRDELRELAEDHWQRRGNIAGPSSLENRVGIHAQTPEERLAFARMGYQQGLGQCSETVMFYARLKAVLAQGKIPFSDEEKNALVELAQDQNYQHPPGSKNPGQPAYQHLQAELHRRFGVKRTLAALRSAYGRIKRKKE